MMMATSSLPSLAWENFRWEIQKYKGSKTNQNEKRHVCLTNCLNTNLKEKADLNDEEDIIDIILFIFFTIKHVLICRLQFAEE